MSAINVNSITGRTGTHGPVLTGVTTATNGLHVGSGISVSGISTFNNTVVGGATTELVVGGDARITGVLTVGQGSVTIGSTNITTQQINDLNFPTAGALSNRNLIINGAMNIWQRNNTYNVINVSNNFNEDYQSVDRFAFRFGNAAGGAVGIAKTTDVPLNQGFSNAYKVGVVTTITPTTNEIIYPVYVVEAQDMRNSGWNYNDPNSFITISFWTKSNKTGTYNLGAFTDDGVREFFTKEYTINSSDTWEYKEISIPGYSGIEFNDDNGVGLRICWHLCVGSDRNQGTSGSWSTDASDFSTSNQINFMDTVGNNWYLTGVQSEVGTRATPFEHRRYSEELALCQRYYYKLTNANSYKQSVLQAFAASNVYGKLVDLPTTMRVAPTITDDQSTASSFLQMSNSGASGGVNINVTTWNSTPTSILVFNSGPTTPAGGAGSNQTLVAGNASTVNNSSNIVINADAEF